MARKRKKKPQITSGRILDIVKKRESPVKLKDIFKELRPGSEDREWIHSILETLVAQGKLISLGRGKAFGLPERMSLVRGTLEMISSGAGFVLTDDQRRKDIFVSPSNLGEAWPGDRVVVALLPQRKGRNPEGRIVRILERRMQEVPVVLHKKMKPDLFWAQPMDPELRINFLVQVADLPTRPRIGEVVVLTPEERLDQDLWQGRASRHLGPETEITVQEAVVKLNHHIPSSFPPEAVSQAEDLPQDPSPEDMQDRTDLRDLPFVTIDGATAKDFDDAVCVQTTDQGTNLLVAIADVSHYVPIGSPLDREARLRGNSYYFPQSVEPMFPPALSTGLCSLNPQVSRLAMVVDMTFSAQGKRQKAEMYPAIIRSQARLTYSQVKEAVLDGDAATQEQIKSVMPMLEQALSLARVLFTKRQERGSLDFDLPEPEILFTLQGEARDIRPRARHFGHQIIEEFMIAANEAVAEFLQEQKKATVYRIHPEPDPEKLNNLFSLLRSTQFAHELPADTDIKSLQSLLTSAEGSDLEFLVNRLLLRTMMQASYSPDNQGHFGLGSNCYTHFTSPIRRYADLIVHRSLRSVLNPDAPPGHGRKGLRKLCLHISHTERTAMQAEREILKRMTILFLQDKIGEEFTGLINGVSDFGFWVELKEVMAEGLVRLSTITDDYYQFLPKEHKLLGQHTGRTFTLGQKVSVQLSNVSLKRLEIDFELI
ncbi:MAG: ribonuclease R [Desulfovermiculus sp.]